MRCAASVKAPDQDGVLGVSRRGSLHRSKRSPSLLRRLCNAYFLLLAGAADPNTGLHMLRLCRALRSRALTTATLSLAYAKSRERARSRRAGFVPTWGRV